MDFELFSKTIYLRNRWLLILSLIIVIVLILGGYKLWGSKSSSPQYQTAKAEKGNIVSSVSVSGSILASNFTDATTQASGMVKKLYVKEGDRVSAGQKIAEVTLDSDSQKTNQQNYSAYIAAKNSLESSYTNQLSLHSQMVKVQEDFENNATLQTLARGDPVYLQAYENKLVAEQKYNQQAIVIEQAKIAMNNAWLTYQKTSPTVYSPVSGTVVSLLAAEGMSLSSSTSSTSANSQSSSSSEQKLAVIKTERKTLGSFNVSEVDIGKIKVGQKVTISLDSLENKTFTGTVVAVDRVGSTSNGVTSYPATVSFDSDSPEVFPNMSSSANIILDSKQNVLLVSSSAIQTQNNQKIVRVLKNGQVQNVNVETGLSSDTQTEITSGLSEGDEVVVSTVSASSQFNSTSIFGGFGGGTRGGVVIRQ